VSVRRGSPSVGHGLLYPLAPMLSMEKGLPQTCCGRHGMVYSMTRTRITLARLRTSSMTD